VQLAPVRIGAHKWPHFKINPREEFWIICAVSYVFDFFIIKDCILVSFQDIGPDSRELCTRLMPVLKENVFSHHPM
jgi:hypothetical protein